MATMQAKFAAVNGVAKALEQKLSSNKGAVFNVDQRVQHISQQSEAHSLESMPRKDSFKGHHCAAQDELAR